MRWFFAGVSALCLIAAGLWGRAALLRYRFLRSVEQETTDPDARTLASSNLSHVAHAAGVYLAIAVAAAVGAVTHDERAALLLGLLVVPIVSTIWLSRYARRDARLSFLRLGLEQRAHEVLSQEDSATQRWAERLAPSRFPDTTGYEVGTAHQAGTGVMSGDLLDVFAYADHHPYTPAELADLRAHAKAHGATLITTEKDHVRLPSAARKDIAIFPVAVRFADEAPLRAALDRALEK